MGCGPKSSARTDADSAPHRVWEKALEETGRLHFFYHSPSSSLPVRDVLNDQGAGYKKEPYLEKSAENYCVPCLQRNIHGFVMSNEKYLFLFTTRKNSKHDESRYIVGYLKKQKCLRRFYKKERHWAVQGPIRLFSFDQAFPLRKLRGLGKSAADHLRFKK